MDVSKSLDMLAGKMNPQALLGAMQYRVARSIDELEKAYSLVYKQYLKRNYTTSNSSGLRISKYNALPQTTTFVGVSAGEVLVTATLVPDSPLGLPMDDIYSQELGEFRANNQKICEISMLASDTDIFKNGTSMLLNAKKMFFFFFLFKAIFDYARDVAKLDYLCITINPKHKLTYDFLMFKDIGELKTYEGANHAPAVAKCLDVNAAEEECIRNKKEGLRKMFFLSKTDLSDFSGKVSFTVEDLKSLFLEKSSIFKDISKKELEYIKSCYSSYDFSQINK